MRDEDRFLIIVNSDFFCSLGIFCKPSCLLRSASDFTNSGLIIFKKKYEFFLGEFIGLMVGLNIAGSGMIAKSARIESNDFMSFS